MAEASGGRQARQHSDEHDLGPTVVRAELSSTIRIDTIRAQGDTGMLDDDEDHPSPEAHRSSVLDTLQEWAKDSRFANGMPDTNLVLKAARHRRLKSAPPTQVTKATAPEEGSRRPRKQSPRRNSTGSALAVDGTGTNNHHATVYTTTRVSCS